MGAEAAAVADGGFGDDDRNRKKAVRLLEECAGVELPVDRVEELRHSLAPALAQALIGRLRRDARCVRQNEGEYGIRKVGAHRSSIAGIAASATYV